MSSDDVIAAPFMVFYCLCESADTFSLGTIKHHKRCSCDVIKERLYVVLTLVPHLPKVGSSYLFSLGDVHYDCLQ